MSNSNPISKRVFCVGMNKTGTSTMKHCFELLNLTPIASPKTYTSEERPKIREFYNHKNYSEMLDLAEHYKTFEDRPWNMWSMYRHLHERYPDSLFILTVRDPESWWRSTERWVTVTKPIVLERYQLHLRVDQPSKESMIDSYLRYNREVEDYFKGTGQLLLMNFERGDGWEKLCEFLGVRVPQIEFPHANRQRYTPEDAEMIKKKRRLKNGLECQACHNLTILKKEESPGLFKNLASSKSSDLVSYSRIILRRIRKIKPQDLQGSLAARKLLYSIHRILYFLKAPLHNVFPRGEKAFQRSLPDNELAVVSCFFNPGGSTRRVKNFRNFLAAVKNSGVRCLVVELAFGSAPFEFDDHEDVIQLRSNDVLWHKERLLNIGIRQLLSDGVRKIAWLDGDIVFADHWWPSEIASRLEHANLCQVFDTISIHTHDSGPPMIAPSAVKYFQEDGRLFSQPPLRGRNLLRGMLKGGQSGFGWAARSEVLEKALLFENAVVGGGDKLIFAASLTEDLSDERLQALTHSKHVCRACGHRNKSDTFTASYLEWARQWSNAVDGSVDYARLHISDMYHGKRSDRGYMARHDILYRHEFNPATDLSGDPPECLQWSTQKKQLRREVEAYFLSRREDI